jgi:hypothetical protein
MIKPVDTHSPIPPERQPGAGGGRPAAAAGGPPKITRVPDFAFIWEFFFAGIRFAAS